MREMTIALDGGPAFTTGNYEWERDPIPDGLGGHVAGPRVRFVAYLDEHVGEMGREHAATFSVGDDDYVGTAEVESMEQSATGQKRTTLVITDVRGSA